MMKAIIYDGRQAVLQRNRPLPKLRDDYILIKVAAVALNPTDWKHVAGARAAPGGILGCDFSGVVQEVGPAVTKAWSKGDHVMGVAHGGNLVEPDDGAFAEYIVAKGDIQIKKPPHLSFEQACTAPLGATTVGQGLYQKALGLAWPTDPVKKKTDVLIFGGSTATGALGIQYAKLSGYTVTTTCSPRNFAYVKELGADSVFDYHDTGAAARIREQTGNKLKYAWDTISDSASAQFCAQALSTESGCRYGTILPVPSPRDDVRSVSTFMYTVFGEEFDLNGTKIAAVPEDFEFAKKFMALTETLLAEGKLRPHAHTLGQGGLEGVLQGLDELQNGRVSGSKLVYRLE